MIAGWQSARYRQCRQSASVQGHVGSYDPSPISHQASRHIIRGRVSHLSLLPTTLALPATPSPTGCATCSSSSICERMRDRELRQLQLQLQPLEPPNTLEMENAMERIRGESADTPSSQRSHTINRRFRLAQPCKGCPPGGFGNVVQHSGAIPQKCKTERGLAVTCKSIPPVSKGEGWKCRPCWYHWYAITLQTVSTEYSPQHNRANRANRANRTNLPNLTSLTSFSAV